MRNAEHRGRRRGRTACLGALPLVAAAAALVPSHAHGGDWTFTPRVSLNETLSDNVGLATGGAEQGDLISELTAGFGLDGKGRRLKLFLDYQGQGLKYAAGTGETAINHQVQGNGTAELLADTLFLDFNAVAGQRNLSSAGRQATDNLSVNANRGAFLSYGASPYLKSRFGSYADAELRYRLDEVSSDGATDTSIQEISARLDSGREFAVLPWTLTASDQRSKPQTGSTTSFRKLDLGLRYAFTRAYAARLNTGYESNDQGGGASDSGINWRLTGIWTPTERSTFELGYGRRIFGNNLSFSARHRMRRAVITAGYSEDLTTGNINQSRTQLFAVEDAFGAPIANPGAVADRTVALDSLDAGNTTVLQRRFNLGLAMQWQRTNASISAYHDRRETQSAAGGDEKVFGVDARVTRRLSRKTSATLAGNWQRSDAGAAAGASDDELISIDMRLTRQFSKDLSGSLSYRHQRETSQGSGDYTENRLGASVQMLF